MIDWSAIGLGNVLTMLVLGITGLVAYFGWQRAVENKFNILKESFEGKFGALALQINTILEGDIRERRLFPTGTEIQ